MTDKEKLDTIRAEIERRIAKRRSEIEKYCGSLIDKEKLQEDLELLSFIDSLEEPVKCMYTNEHYTDEDRKVLCEDCEERCEYSKKEEPVSEQNLSNVQRTTKNWKEPVSEKDKLRALSDGKQHLGWLDDADALEEPIEEAAESIIPKCDTYIEHDNGSIEPVYPYSTLIYMFKAGANWQKTKDSTCVSNDLEEAAKEWLIPQLDKSYEPYGERKMMELTRFDGYAMLEAIEFGANWMLNKITKQDKNKGG